MKCFEKEEVEVRRRGGGRGEKLGLRVTIL
jgi:hypothetical protein